MTSPPYTSFINCAGGTTLFLSTTYNTRPYFLKELSIGTPPLRSDLRLSFPIGYINCSLTLIISECPHVLGQISYVVPPGGTIHVNYRELTYHSEKSCGSVNSSLRRSLIMDPLSCEIERIWWKNSSSPDRMSFTNFSSQDNSPF